MFLNTLCISTSHVDNLKSCTAGKVQDFSYNYKLKL